MQAACQARPYAPRTMKSPAFDPGPAFLCWVKRQIPNPAPRDDRIPVRCRPSVAVLLCSPGRAHRARILLIPLQSIRLFKAPIPLTYILLTTSVSRCPPRGHNLSINSSVRFPINTQLELGAARPFQPSTVSNGLPHLFNLQPSPNRRTVEQEKTNDAHQTQRGQQAILDRWNEMKFVSTLLLSLALAAGSCSVKDSAIQPSPTTNGSSAEPARKKEFGEAEDQRLLELQRRASLLLETSDWSNIVIISPNVTNHNPIPIAGMSNYIPFSKERGYAVLTIPQERVIEYNRESDDEIIIDIDDAVKRAGYLRTYVVTRPHGFFMVEAHPQGIPSREEAKRIKSRILNAPKLQPETNGLK